MERIKSLQKIISDRGMDAIILLKPINIFYFSGSFVNGVLYVSRDESFLFVRRPKEREIGSTVKTFYIDSFKEIKGYVEKEIKIVGMELDSVPYNSVQRVQKALNFSEVIDITHEVRLLRMIKGVEEIEKLKTAGKIVADVFQKVKEVFKPEMSELELLIELEYYSKKVGNIGIYRMHSFGNEASFSHILQGEDALYSSYMDAPTGGKGISEAFPQGASHKRIERDKPFTIDVMVNYDGYLADATRTFYYGKLSDDVIAFWSKLESIFSFVKDKIKPGISGDEIYKSTLEYANSLGVGDYFMGIGRDRVKFIGHGIGLEVDEYPFIAKGFSLPLQENSVIAVEPKLINKTFGILGVEDTFLLTADGPESLIPFKDYLVEL